MILDTYDTHNPINPINQPEIEVEYSELEEQQNWNMELCEKIHKMKNDFKKLKEIEEMYNIFGKISFEEQKQKTEILNKY